MINLLSLAIDFYFSHGIECFPCTLTIVDGKKKYDGSNWKSAITKQQAQEMLNDAHNSIALKTGSCSNLFVLDCDIHDGINGLDILKEEGIIVPDGTPTQTTQSGGKHFFFSFPEELKGAGTTSKKSKGIDTRGENGLIFAAPSKVTGGGDYRFDVKITNNNLKLPPKQLLDWLFPKEEPKKEPQQISKTNFGIVDLTAKQRDWFDRDMNACAITEKGARSETDFRFCCTCIRLSLRKDEIWSLIKSLGKFSTNGERYFDRTWDKADKEIPYTERREYRMAHFMPTPDESDIPQAPRPANVVYVNDIWKNVEKVYQHGHPRGLKTGWENVDKYYSIVKGLLNIVTGIPSHGKSEWLDALMINLSVSFNWSFMVFSPENYPLEMHLQKLTEKYLKKSFFGFSRLGEQELEIAKTFLHDHFCFIDILENEINTGTIFSAYDEIINNRKIDGIVIDPFNELENSKERDVSETEAIGNILSTARKFARKNNIALWIVAHPTKLKRDPKTKKYPIPGLYDISGSAHWSNKADFGITVWRDFDADITEIHVDKCKFKYHGAVGVAKLKYQFNSGRYDCLKDEIEDGWNDQPQQNQLFDYANNH